MSQSASVLAADAFSEPEQGRVAVLEAAGQFTSRWQSLPPCGENSVLLRLEGCGICASSVPVWEGREWFEYPLEAGAPGHEAWGSVIEKGAAVRNLQPGQRVACLGGNAFAQYAVVPEQQVVALPEALDAIPFPGEAIGCAMNIFRRSQVQRGQTVAIIGAGFLGLLLVQLCAAAGARVLVFSRRASVRQLAIDYGAQTSFDTEDWWGNAQQALEATDGRGCERVIEVTGLQFALDLATELVAEYGRLVIGGYHQDGQRQINMQKWNWRAIDVINAHERDPRRYVQGIEEAIEATIEGRIFPQDLLTHRFTLDQLDEAFRMMIERPDGFIKGWVQL